MDDPQKAGVIGGTQWYLNHLAAQHSGDYPRIPSSVPLVAFPRGRAVSLFDPIKKAMKAHGMLRPANKFGKRTGTYSRIEDLLKVVPERYHSVIDGRQGPLLRQPTGSPPPSSCDEAQVQRWRERHVPLTTRASVRRCIHWVRRQVRIRKAPTGCKFLGGQCLLCGYLFVSGDFLVKCYLSADQAPPPWVHY